jgi:hypothetical protein
MGLADKFRHIDKANVKIRNCLESFSAPNDETYQQLRFWVVHESIYLSECDAVLGCQPID